MVKDRMSAAACLIASHTHWGVDALAPCNLFKMKLPCCLVQPPCWHGLPAGSCHSLPMLWSALVHSVAVLIVVHAGPARKEREFGLWGTFRVVLFHGTKPAKQAALASIASGSSEVLITNYHMLRWVTLRTSDARKWAATLLALPVTLGPPGQPLQGSRSIRSNRARAQV